MKRRLVVRPEAEIDAEEAAFWYDSQQFGLGDQFMEELDRLLRRLVETPLQFPEVGFGARRGLTRRFPYSVYFLMEADSVIVVAVLHQHRSPKIWRLRLP